MKDLIRFNEGAFCGPQTECRRPLAALFAFSLLAVLVLLPPRIAMAALPVLESDLPVATAGYYRLSWALDGAAATLPVFELQESLKADFADPATVYRGPDEASVMSGRGDGEYWYRVRAADGDWSEPVNVVVRHHPLSRALGFFAVGALVFLAILVVIVRGSMRTSGDQ